MATINYNSGNINVSMFPTNASSIWFCDKNTAGINIATNGSTIIPNTIQLGNLNSSVIMKGTTQLAGGWLSTDNTFNQCIGTQSPLSNSNYALYQNNVGTIIQTVGYTAFQTSGTERMRLLRR